MNTELLEIAIYLTWAIAGGALIVGIVTAKRRTSRARTAGFITHRERR